MSTKRELVAVLVFCALVLVVTLGPEQAGLAQGPAPLAQADPASVAVPYPGTLSGPAGEPVPDGPYEFAFSLYGAESGGEPLWSEVLQGVSVEQGAFEVALGSATALPAALFDGGARWLAVSVRGPGETAFTALDPRQPFSAGSTAPGGGSVGANANGACAHDHVGEVWSASIPWNNGALKVLNYANGPTLWGWNGGGGNGVRGYATGSGLGVYGESQDNAGVVGRSTTKRGVEGYTKASTYPGVYGRNESGGGFGVIGYAPNGTGIGVWGQGASFGLWAQGNLRVTGDSIFSGSKSGYVVDVAQNDDSVSLETGDLVMISGAGPAVLGEIPVIKVRRATDERAGAIVGIVDKHFSPASGEDELAAAAVSALDDLEIGPGEHLTIVTLGAYKAIKVDASYGAIEPGDRLVASPRAGYAMRADAPSAGTIIGKALDGLSSGTGTLPVVVTLQ